MTIAIVAAASLAARAQGMPEPPRSPSPVPPRQDATPPSNAAAPPRLQVEVIGKDQADPRIESTATKIVVNHGEIVRYGDASLADVLKRLPGISVIATPGQNAEIRMRGLGAGYTQILLDGEPAPPGFSLETLSPELIERIEIQRAPTADISAQAIAGTINIVLRKAAKKAQRNLKLTTQEQGGRPAFTVDGQLSDQAGPFSYTLAGTLSHEETENASLNEQVSTDTSGNTAVSWLTRQVDRPRSDALTLSPRLNWTGGESDTVSTDLFLRHSRLADTFTEQTDTTVGAPPSFARDALGFRIDATAARGRLNWKHRASGGVTLDAKVGVNYFHRYSDARFKAFDAGDVFVLDRTVLSGATERGLVTSGKYLTPIIEGHAIAVGWDDEYSQRTEYRLQQDLSPVGLPPYDIDENYDARVWRTAVFLQDEWDITRRWSAYVGVRWEGLDTRTTGNVIREVHNRFGVVSPVLQTLWKMPGSEKDQVRLSVSRTYKAPTTFELTPRRYIANNNTVATPDFQGNPELRPELAWGIDAAYEHHWGEDGLFSISAFARRIDNVILRELFNNNGTWFLSPTNSGNVRVQGVELEAKFALRSWFKAAPDVRAHANLARNWSAVEQVPGPDNRLDRQTPLTGNVGFDYVADGLPLTVGTNFTYTGGGPVRLSLSRSSYTSVRRVLDAYALWKFERSTQLRLSLSNVLAQDNLAIVRYADGLGSTQLTTTAPTRIIVRAALEVAF